MKLRKLYCNIPKIFPPIAFKDGLNVIFAKVKNPQLSEKDSHNLGKTFLISVIDFTLLGTVNKDHAFNRNRSLFDKLTFFIQLETNNQSLVTIRRAVEAIRGKSISINIDHVDARGIEEIPSRDWTYPALGRDRAKAILDDALELSAIQPFDYRKGLGYFLRRQSDYENEFFISRFGRGKDRDWKPFMALLLGFDSDLVASKYALDHERSQIETTISKIEAENGEMSEEIDEIKGIIEIRSSEITELRDQLDSYDFVEIESDISKKTIEATEIQIAKLNQDRFIIEAEKAEITASLAADFPFDIESIQRVFDEAGRYFPKSLLRDYSELIQFNRRISESRKRRLQSRLVVLGNKLDRLNTELVGLNHIRQEGLKILMQEESIEKFRALQLRLVDNEADLLRLKMRLNRLDQAGEFRNKIRQITAETLLCIESIEKMIHSENRLYSEIRRLFSKFAKRILATSAILSTSINLVGNLEFRTRIIENERSKKETAEGEGTSYRKVLCACFDLAQLAARADQSFYRFVYHDGIFEGLDNRRKVALLSTVRDTCKNYNLQYILTVIDSDLPRNEDDQKLLFDDSEVVRELNDSGDKGRLFRTSKF